MLIFASVTTLAGSQTMGSEYVTAQQLRTRAIQSMAKIFESVDVIGIADIY
jgi:hypothetical protein